MEERGNLVGGDIKGIAWECWNVKGSWVFLPENNREGGLFFCFLAVKKVKRKLNYGLSCSI